MANGVGWQISTSAEAFTDASFSCHTLNVSNRICRSSSGRSSRQSNAVPTHLIITSGAATAAVARREPSNTATFDRRAARLRIVTFAKCTACGVSRRSSKRALTPTRSAGIRDMRARTLPRCRSDLACTTPTCTSGNGRHAEYTSRLCSLDSISGSASAPTVGTSAAITTKRTAAGQPKKAGDFPQVPVVEDATVKQRVNHEDALRRLTEQPSLLLFAISGHHGIHEHVLGRVQLRSQMTQCLNVRPRVHGRLIGHQIPESTESDSVELV